MVSLRTSTSRGPKRLRLAAVAATAAIAGAALAGTVASNAGASTNAPSKPTLVDVVSVVANGNSTASHVALRKGVKYTIRVTGTLSVSHSGTIGDAEYAVLSNGTIQDNCAGSPATDIGVGINTPGALTQKQPVAWGAYASSHIYETGWVGAGAAIRFNYHDCLSSDNRGHVVARIYAG
jgi:hypothetical protein